MVILCVCVCATSYLCYIVLFKFRDLNVVKANENTSNGGWQIEWFDLRLFDFWNFFLPLLVDWKFAHSKNLSTSLPQIYLSMDLGKTWVNMHFRKVEKLNHSNGKCNGMRERASERERMRWVNASAPANVCRNCFSHSFIRVESTSSTM